MPLSDTHYKTAHVRGFGNVPWSTHERAWEAYALQYGTRQSARRIAERGGFSIEEMDSFHPSWRDEATEIGQLRSDLDKAHDFIEREGYRSCDTPACNCGSWHAREGWYARFCELEDALRPENGETLLACAQRHLDEHERLRSGLCELMCENIDGSDALVHAVSNRIDDLDTRIRRLVSIADAVCDEITRSGSQWTISERGAAMLEDARAGHE